MITMTHYKQISNLFLRVTEPKNIAVVSQWFYTADVEEHHEEMLDQMEAEYYGW